MATNKYNITFILILVLIIIVLWSFMTIGSSYKYYNLSKTPIIEGATEFTTEFKKNSPVSLIQDEVLLQKHWGLSFTVKTNGIITDNQWHQVIGVTPYPDARDNRFLGVWFWPNTSVLHIRTATLDSWNDDIKDLHELPLEFNKEYRIDIISNLTNSGDKQNIVVYLTNITDKQQIRQIANKQMAAPKFISTKGSKLQLIPGQIDVDKVYTFSTYNSCWLPIDGSIKDVVFVSGLNDPIVPSNLTDAINYNRAKAAQQTQTQTKTQTFTTMSGSTMEGLTNIGGIGNNGNVPGFTPPIPPTNGVPVSSPLGDYKPIWIEDKKSSTGTRELCTTSVIQPTDPSYNWIAQYGYNYPIEFNNSNGQPTKTVPICSPDDLYLIQTKILDEINNFNKTYADFIAYQYNVKHSVAGDTTPKLKYPSGMTESTASAKFSGKLVTNLQEYINLSQDLETYNNLLKANKAYYPNPENPNNSKSDLKHMDPIILGHIHKEIVDKRNELDTKLFELNNVQNSAAGESKMNMDSSIYVTLLWTTLATSIIYFMFV